jgi:predicted metal-binding protein
MREVFEEALNNRAHEYGVAAVPALTFSRETLKACEANSCGKYNRCWTCPPAIGAPEDHLKKIGAYKRAFVFTTKHDLEDSFDYEGMMRGKEKHDRLTGELHERFGKANPVFGAGGCTLCAVCAYPLPCRFPEKIFPSIEAAGIDVTALSRAAGIKYHNGPNTVTYFSMLLYND